MKLPLNRPKDLQKRDECPMSAEESEALNKPLTQAIVVEVVEMLVARADRRELALRREKRRSTIWKWGTFLFMCTLAPLIFWGWFGQDSSEPVQVISDPIRTIALTGKGGIAHVAFIPISGSIDGDRHGAPGLENTEWYVENALKLAEKQENISAIILNITSYGGDAVASAHGYRMIKKFRERTKIPVIAFISHYAYSGGYYLALGANEIVVDPDANIGSVGVIMSWFNTASIGKVFDVGEVKIATGPLKSCIGQWVELTPACRAGFARSIDVAFKGFLGAMSDSRDIPLSTLIKESRSNTGRSNGGTFAAEDAVARKMADRVEDEDQLEERIAADIAKKHPEFKSVEFIQYDMKLSVLAELSGATKKSIQGVSRFMDALSSMVNARAMMRAE